MLNQIPTHLIAGPLGAGKTTLLRRLLSQRPESERWAILVNEFGLVGIDAALLGTDQGVQLAEIPGGCLCCVNGVPFQIGLGKLLRHARPDRLFIEASGLGHPGALLDQLAAPPWQAVLALQPLVMVLDAEALQAGKALPTAQADALPRAGLLLINKSAGLSTAQQAALTASLPPLPLRFCEDGKLALDALPQQVPSQPQAAVDLTQLPDGPANPTALWRNHDDWHCREQNQDGQYSIGWQIHPAQRFRQDALQDWLGQHPWQRAKGIVQTELGWQSFNALDNGPPRWQASPWRRDNRIELLLAQKPDRQQLERGLRAAGLND